MFIATILPRVRPVGLMKFDCTHCSLLFRSCNGFWLFSLLEMVNRIEWSLKWFTATQSSPCQIFWLIVDVGRITTSQVLLCVLLKIGTFKLQVFSIVRFDRFVTTAAPFTHRFLILWRSLTHSLSPSFLVIDTIASAANTNSHKSSVWGFLICLVITMITTLYASSLPSSSSLNIIWYGHAITERWVQYPLQALLIL